MEESASQEKLLVKENLRSEITFLEENIEKIIGIRSLLSLEDHIQSVDVLRNVIAKEVDVMHDDINALLHVFENKIETIFASFRQPTMLNVEVTMADITDNSKNVVENHESLCLDEEEINAKLEPVNDGSNSTHSVQAPFDNIKQDETKIKVEIEGAEDWFSHQKSSNNFKLLKTFSCMECNTTFSTHLELKCHYKECHDKDGVPCSICYKLLKFPSDVAVHMTCAHTGEKPFICLVCGKMFSRQSSFKAHQRIHSIARPFSCKICGKSFRSKQNVQSHYILHEKKKKIICSVCGKCFLRSQNLLQHMKTHKKVTSQTKRRKRKI